MKKFLHVLLAVGAVISLSLATAGTASASPTSGWTQQRYATPTFVNQWLYKDGTARAVAKAEANHSTYGEVITITDHRADGFGQIVHWQGDGKSGSCKNEKGDGGTVRCDFNITEGNYFSWRLCAKDGSTLLACTNWDSMRA